MHVTLSDFNGNLILRFPYDPGLIAAVKSLPTSNRRWDGNLKAWIIDPSVGDQLTKMIELHTGDKIRLPKFRIAKPETRILTVIYLGRCKDRNGEKSAFAMTEGGEWNVIILETALRAWFEVDDEIESPSEQSNLFAILGVHKTASVEEIKTGYRRMAKLWHPDVNRNDPDAAEQFMRIQEAWEILSIDKSRLRYLAGLQLQESMPKSKQIDTQYQNVQVRAGYRSPLRCGHIMAEGIEKTGRFVVSKILEWQDIYNSAGEMLVTSWSSGADKPTLIYV